MGTLMKEVEDSAATFRADTDALKAQVNDLKATTKSREARLEDYEGRSRCNNLHNIGVPERSHRLAVDLCVEALITDKLQPRGLSQ
ncbi:hypothetical protein NDU88_011923 [Pleurodeles waltl]|uniref:Uncharacterized protein n=1 Tax=Pleurodeles waltl TaxID=8319 RepID=A0AAV7R1U8_PLEWA|nr:hypothetical protein NDU88_011923 [Pleurodeles waltl]